MLMNEDTIGHDELLQQVVDRPKFDHSIDSLIRKKKNELFSNIQSLNYEREMFRLPPDKTVQYHEEIRLRRILYKWPMLVM